ncbi:MAG: adenylate/guanylate cyclase domain-containing protein [Spirochaetaceae bacterium]|jgi:class 3 adenylate cyclase/HAMP domain-containing protein|nr:adenylate/guanylate cyclase domain-containing protein [Spirochaetaceae bacterium]
MRIRSKIILVVLPILILTLVLAQAAGWFSATNGVTRLAQELLSFKIYELEKYADNQWGLLVDNGYSTRPEMLDAAKNAVSSYSRSLILSDSELIFALDSDGNLVMATKDIALNYEEKTALRSGFLRKSDFLGNGSIGGVERVYKSFYFAPFDWYICLTEEWTAFYHDVDTITTQTIIALVSASLLAIILLLIFSQALTRPLNKIIRTMNTIIGSADLSSRVEVEYNDETGKLAQTFNAMIGDLERAYKQTKRFAFESVLARKKEQRIRQIFQKYVPKDLIDKFFASPESMLVGENRELAILFSDIRSFTTISESLAPDDLVNSLNRYFSAQVDIIMNHNGMVDKYIGDAIMAIWGAPVKHDDDALQSVLSGLDMIDALKGFNENQQKLGKPEFHIGIGINLGLVTVGNIGSERKMDYTVIGDSVNLASRLEGLTKTYRETLLISESLYMLVKGKVPARLLDTVAVKGKTRGIKIFAVRRTLNEAETQGWKLHNEAMLLFYKKQFAEAKQKLEEVLSILPGDFNAENIITRCTAYIANPPAPQWDGVEVMKTK